MEEHKSSPQEDNEETLLEKLESLISRVETLEWTVNYLESDVRELRDTSNDWTR